MSDLGETCYDHVSGEKYCTATAAEYWSKNMFNKLNKKYPSDVTIIAKNNDGSMVVRFPYSWLPRIHPKHTKNLTEEQRSKLSERMKTLQSQSSNR
ncbi:MAG: hypothetical protein WCR36_07830 [Bacteroidaceae bacterium]